MYFKRYFEEKKISGLFFQLLILYRKTYPIEFTDQKGRCLISVSAEP